MKATRATTSVPTIDHVEVTWAADEVAAILRQTDPDSVVGTVLEQTLRELTSLKLSAEATVVGPFRMKAA
jgi:hypothetical protein